jgi:hypothetical protein
MDMASNEDLHLLDRATLRTWRLANVLGWWFAGAVAFNVLVFVLDRAIVQKIADLSLGGATVVVMLAVFVFSAGTAGAIVGSRVYRSPGLIAACTVLIPWGVMAAISLLTWGIPEATIAPLLLFLGAGVAARVAIRVFAKRPRALRGGLDPAPKAAAAS